MPRVSRWGCWHWGLESEGFIEMTFWLDCWMSGVMGDLDAVEKCRVVWFRMGDKKVAGRTRGNSIVCEITEGWELRL